jgi:hypothetical protein
MVPYPNSGTTSSVVCFSTEVYSSSNVFPWMHGNIAYSPELEDVPTPTRADAARAAMREFLISVRPGAYRLSAPTLDPRPRLMSQMVHRLRCPSRGLVAYPRLSRLA